MFEDVIDPSEQAPLDEISSPISAQIFDFCDPELFSETLQNSEATSRSHCCYEENSYASSFPVPPDLDKFNNHHQHSNANTSTNTPTPTTTTTSTNTTTTTAATTSTNNSNLSIIFDSPEQFDNDISASIDFSPSPPFSSVPNLPQNNQQVDQFDFSTVQQHQIPLTSDIVVDGLSAASHYSAADPVAVPLMGPPLPSVFEEDCLPSVPSYAPFTPSSPSSYSFLGPAIGSYMPAAGTMNAAALSADTSGLFAGGIFMGSDFQPQELDYQGDNARIFCTDSLQRVFNPGDLQKALSSESQQLVGGAANPTPLASEISNLDDPILKVGKLSVEQRKEKIHRYMKKRNERNFSKKIKYACRKTLADSRPRVRGRFAKNDDFGENPRPSCSNHEEDTDDEVVVKEEEELVDSSDIFAHISGVNSFKCNYPIQSWI